MNGFSIDGKSGRVLYKMHPNSLKAWEEIKDKINPRMKMIVHFYRTRGPMTDRDMMLCFSKSDPNYVRPRITELIEYGVAFEIGNKSDNGRTVRIVGLDKPAISNHKWHGADDDHQMCFGNATDKSCASEQPSSECAPEPSTKSSST